MIDYAARRRAAQRLMAEQGIDLLAVWPSEQMTYLLGYHPHPDERPCYLLLTREQHGMLVPALNAEEVAQHVTVPMETYSDAEGPDAALRRLLEQLGATRVGTVALDETMRTDFTLLLLEALGNPTPRVATELLGALRMRKDPEEIRLIDANAALADDAMRAAYAAVEIGASERDVARAVRQAFEASGVDQVNFAIVASGPNGAHPHHSTGDRRLQSGDAVVIDIGARKDAYNSDITRMAYLGEPSSRYLEVHHLVEQAVQAALAAARPGARACDVDRAARTVIRDGGYGEYFVHRTGHGLGLTGHEPPYLTGTNEQRLEEGMVFSIEPGIYLPGEFGVRLEEIVTLTADGARIFSRLPRDLQVVAG